MSSPAPKRTEEFLDSLKVSLQLPSDYALAKHWGISPQVISNYRSKRSLPDPVMAKRIADETGMQYGYVLARINAERAAKEGNPGLSQTWDDLAEKMGLLAEIKAEQITVRLLKKVKAAMLEGEKHGWKVLAGLIVGATAIAGAALPYPADASGILHNTLPGATLSSFSQSNQADNISYAFIRWLVAALLAALFWPRHRLALRQM